MSAHRLSFVLAFLLPAAIGGKLAAADKEPVLTGDDKKYLAGLLQEFLFDPQGAERVRVPITVRTVWASNRSTEADGWFVPGNGDKPGRVYFIDGASIPAPDDKRMKKLDFVAACKARYAAPAVKKDDLAPDDAFRKMGRNAVGAVEDDDLALAAWLHRFEHEDLAAKALAAARKGKEDPRHRLRGELAWSAFASMVHAYMVRADEEALAHGERLLRLYAEETKTKEFAQSAAVVAELKRRQKKGTFGKAPPEGWADGFDKWNMKKKTDYLIDALEEVDARQWGQPGGVDLASDRRVEALIRLGDAAVPALIDALEKDERLTRSVHFWRDFARSRTVLSVREAVLTALMSCLRVRVFEPASTGDNFTARGEEGAKVLAGRLRTYWKEYGHLPFDERMMKVLTDPKTSFEAKREAAENLGTLTEDRRLRTTIYPTVIGDDAPRKSNPAVAKFRKPTTAEAILAAMDADLKALDARPRDDRAAYERRQIEGTYLSALIELGDQLIAPELATRAAAAATVPRTRRLWAQAAHYLGDAKPFRSFAEDFRAGKVAVAVGPDGERELTGIVGALVGIGTPEAELALAALADPKHPQHPHAARQVLAGQLRGFDEGPWFSHPFCLRILRTALDDTTPTGATFVIEENNLRRKVKDGWSGGGVPTLLADPAVRRPEAAERACDTAAEKVVGLIVGLPEYHPLLKDSDQRLVAIKAALDRFGGQYRRATRREAEVLGRQPWGPTYLPDIRPLGRAATAEDVKAGRALFHLGGKGMPADLKLPAVAVLKRDEKSKEPARMLIVQAEIGPEGDAVYGVITREGTRAVSASELTGVKTFLELEKEERAAAEKEKVKKD